jgi:polyhydroxyalkanoate synthesis repressor PhaR
MSEPVRLIKKYPNRRLYDTKTSAYITLGDVKDLVLKFEVFKVVDAKTGEDLTRSILLQIILEEETGGMPMFSSELLSGFIRFYGSTMQGMLGKYLENNMKTFVDFQQKLQEQSRTMYGAGDNSPHADGFLEPVPQFPAAGHAEHDDGLHGSVEEDVPVDAGPAAKPDATCSPVSRQAACLWPVESFRVQAVVDLGIDGADRRSGRGDLFEYRFDAQVALD